MAIPLDVVDKAAKTFFDILRVKPSDFLSLRAADPTCYLSPYQYLTVCMGLSGSLLFVEIGLLDGILKELANHKIEVDASARVGRIIALLATMIVVSSIFVTFFARRWPIRSSVELKEVFEFLCYGVGTLLPPVTALEVLVAPLISELVLKGIFSNWTIYIYPILNFLVGNFFFFKIVLPGYSHLLRKTKTRIFWGLAFWSLIILSGIGFIVVFVSAFLVALQRAV
jgi:hypothetical protein